MCLMDVKNIKKIKVFLIDDHDSVRESYRRVLESDEISICGDADTLGACEKELRIAKPDVLLMDIDFPKREQGGLDDFKKVAKVLGHTRIVFVTHYDDISTIIRAFQMGAVSYFPKSGEISILRSVIAAAAKGETLLSPMVAGRIVSFLRGLNHQPKPVSMQTTVPLSSGEARLLQLIASGLTNKDMASTLGTNEKTVKNRIAILFQKLSAKNRSHAVSLGFRFGLLRPDAVE